MLEAGELPAGGFRRLAERGFSARRSRPPTPSLTAVAHVTHVTGALPRDTGIVANEMMDFGKPFGTRLSGFDAPIRAETLARPGIAVERSSVADRTSGGPLHFGGHGYRSAFRQLDATFVAAGPGIARRRVEDFPSTGIASFVSRVLGLDPPRNASPPATPPPPAP